jgi:hypothetical protein
VIATLVSFAIGIWDRNHNSPVSGFVFLCLTVPLFWVGAYFAWDKKRKELATAVASLTATRPNVEVEVMLAYILPLSKSANCFAQVRLHNIVPDTRARILEYEFCLEINGESYCTRAPLDASAYGIGRIEWDDENGPPSSYISEAVPLPDLRQKLKSGGEPLMAGVPEEGWIRFEVPTLPEWPLQETVVDQEQVWDDEEGWIPQEITETEYFASTVTAVEVSVEDSYRTWTRERKVKPFGNPDFGIRSLPTNTK